MRAAEIRRAKPLFHRIRGVPQRNVGTEAMLS
jgi:hypothetical protein